MAINKAKTSLGVKVVLIIVIVAFVAMFVPLIPGFFRQQQSFDQTGQTSSAAGAGTVSEINAQYAPGAQSLQAAVASDPTSYTALVSLGNIYLDWAARLQQASLTSTSAAGTDGPLWVAAKDAYGKALKVKGTEASLMGDYAVSLFYSGDTQGAIKYGEMAVAKQPDFTVVWFNLGNFYSQAGNKDKAINAYQQALKLEPNGQSAAAAKERIQALQAGK